MYMKIWNGTDVKRHVVQVCDYTGDALPGEERERWLPLVPLPELRANIKVEVQHLGTSVFSYTSGEICSVQIQKTIFYVVCL